MSDAVVLEILKDIQSRMARLEAEAATTSHAITGLQQDVRMIRVAVNDMAHTRVSTGEVEALHFELDQLRAEVREHETRLNMLEHRRPAE